MTKKIEPKRNPKLSLNNQKTIWPELNTKIAYSLCNFASIGHISLVLTPNYKLFEVLDSWLPNLQNHVVCPKKFMGVSPNFELKMTSLYYYGSQNKNFQEYFFLSFHKSSQILPFFLNHHKISKKKLQQFFFFLSHHRISKRNFKNTYFFLGHHRIYKRNFKNSYFLLGHHRWIKKEFFLQQ